MNKNYLLFFYILLLIFANDLFAQQKNLWSKIDEVKISNTKLSDGTKIKNYQTFQLTLDDLIDRLKAVSSRSLGQYESNTVVQIPDFHGNLISFKIKESPVMHPKLAAKFPKNKSYKGVNDKGDKVVFSVNELGFHGMIITKDRMVQYIDPISKDNKYYRIYARENLKQNDITFQCFTQKIQLARKAINLKGNKANDLKLRTYRLALASTGEYSEFHIDAAGASSGTDEEKKTVVMAAMTVAITRINSVFENDLSIRFQMVDNNDELIYLDAATDPYDNDDGEAMLDQNQTNCDNVIGTSNYDIGHVLSTGGGGVASLSSVCTNGSKARGVTGSASPTGDNFYFDFIAHEFGHQLGANHTFNGDEGNCSGGQRNDDTAVEPGSGTTLMAYAGLCSPQNIQEHSDLYFHRISIEEIWTNITSGSNNCAIVSDLTSNINIPTADAGNNFTIPSSTPFKLIGQGNDADGDPITFCWEQINNEINSIPPDDTDLNGTLYRSQLPTTVDERYFPKLITVMAGNLSSKWEVIPSVAREMDFSLTVRDNNSEAGQVATDEMKVTVTDLAGPFKVTSQNMVDISWEVGATESVTWDVAGTTTNSINTSQVNILMSIDGGNTFPIVLVSNTPNDGSENITVPNQSAPNCRVMVEAVGNVYYSLNTESFSLGEFVSECVDYDSLDIPKNIPDGSTTGVISTITVTEDDILNDINVSVEITHPFIGDITLLLENPQGASVELISGECFGFGKEDMNVVFDDNASVLVCASSAPVINGMVKPSQELAAFLNQSPLGEWKLKVIDENTEDIGTLSNWSLEICTSRLLPVPDYSINNVMVFPNPSDGIFNVSFQLENENVQISLFDLLGREIRQLQFENSVEIFNEVMDFSDVAAGVYILQIKNGNRFSSKKIKLN